MGLLMLCVRCCTWDSCDCAHANDPLISGLHFRGVLQSRVNKCSLEVHTAQIKTSDQKLITNKYLNISQGFSPQLEANSIMKSLLSHNLSLTSTVTQTSQEARFYDFLFIQKNGMPSTHAINLSLRRIWKESCDCKKSFQILKFTCYPHALETLALPMTIVIKIVMVALAYRRKSVLCWLPIHFNMVYQCHLAIYTSNFILQVQSSTLRVHSILSTHFPQKQISDSWLILEQGLPLTTHVWTHYAFSWLSFR